MKWPTINIASVYLKYVMLYIWCNWKGDHYYEIILKNQMIGSNDVLNDKKNEGNNQ